MDEDMGYAETLELLKRLGALAQELVLVGGQAVNYWAHEYLSRSQRLLADQPFGSKDVDFCGSARTAQACAAALGGTCKVPSMDDLTPCTGVVTYTDRFARPRTVDFLGSPFGLDAREVREMAIPYEEETAGGVLQLRVMHPIHMLESRANNVSRLPGYRTPHGLKQLRASVECAREFSKDLLADERVRDVLRLNERIFRFALRDGGLDVWVRDGVSVMDAVLRDPRLPEAFERVRYPQMRAELEARQVAAAELAYKHGSASLHRFEGDEFRGNRLVAKLRGTDGVLTELDHYRPGATELCEGDLVRLGAGHLELVARGPERERSRGGR
jgi:hypothetical protein